MAPIALNPKQCTRCLEYKPRTEYSRIYKLPNAIRSKCKSCCRDLANLKDMANPEALALRNRRSKLKRAFGISIEQYQQMADKQGNKCALCGSDKPGGKGGKRGSFVVDHCHSSQIIRGLLCNMCNIGLGHFRENIELMKRAIAYIENKGVLN